MIIGCHCIDPRRILSASYETSSIMGKEIQWQFIIQYALGNQVSNLIQYGSLAECKKWLTKANSAVGKHELIEAIASKIIEDEESDDEEENIIGL